VVDRIDQLGRIGEFSEQGRGLPIALSRPGAALPFSPLVAQAYAPSPRARLGWGQGEIAVADVAIEPARALAPDDPPARAAAQLRDNEAGWVAVARNDRFVGVIYMEELLRVLADRRVPPTVERMITAQIPTCAPRGALVDAVRQMIACYLRSIPVVGEDGGFAGRLTLAAAARAGERDPSVRDVLESAAQSPALFARRWR
jgi:CBS domain-containing protein